MHKRKAKRTASFPKIGQMTIQNKNVTRTYMQRHTMTEVVNHSRSNALEQSVKILPGGLNRFYMATTLALSFAMVYTRHLFSPCERFLTHQCNISNNIKIKQIQRWNNNEDSARNSWCAEAKENQQSDSLDSLGPDQPEHQAPTDLT